MNKQDLEIISQQLSKDLDKYNQGVLYKAIHQLPIRSKCAKEICVKFDIGTDTSVDDDLEKINEILYIVVEILIGKHFNLIKNLEGIPIPKEFVNQVGNFPKGWLKVIVNLVQKLFKKENKMEWIVIGGSIAVGLFALLQTRNKRKKGYLPSAPSVTVALCLIVPASEVRDLEENQTVNNFIVKKLIDVSQYFFCTNLKDADNFKLETTRQNIKELPLDSRREVYIRFNIPNGQEMLGETSPYNLKEKLPIENQATVKQILCLKNLSGLDKFNYI